VIIVKTDAQIEIMKKAGRIVGETLQMIGNEIKAGMTTAEIDLMAEEYIISRGARPGFKGYNGFPATACISIDEEVVHGIPSDRKLVDGMIVSIDLGSIVDGFYGDAAYTFAIGDISDEKKKLLEVTQKALEAGMDKVKAGNKLGQISSAVQKTAENAGYSVVREMVGHGLGQSLHEDPQIPNFGSPDDGPLLEKGMTLAIEPMVNVGDYKVKQKPDGWTIVTADGSPSAHFEHSVVVTEDGMEILTTA
jgi:methionyl aminopeptidase